MLAVDDLADASLSDELLRGDELRPVLGVLGDHEHRARLAASGQDPLAGIERGGHRLFEQHVLARPERLDRQPFVQVMREHEVDRIEVSVRQRVFEGGEGLSLGFSCDRLGALRHGINGGGHAHAFGLANGGEVMDGDAAAPHQRQLELRRH